MSARQILGYCLLALCGSAMIYTSGDVPYVLAVCGLTAAGARWWDRWQLPGGRRTILTLLLALIFAARWRYAPHEEIGVAGFVMYPMVHAAGEFFLARMALQMFLHSGGRHSAAVTAVMPLAGTMVMIAAGNILADAAQDRVFGILALGFGALTAGYFAACRHYVSDRRMSRGRLALAGGILLAVLGLSAWSAGVLRANERVVVSLLDRAIYARRPSQGMGFSEINRLDSVRAVKNAREDVVALRVVWDTPPGYLRGRVLDRFERSEWSAGNSPPLLVTSVADDQMTPALAGPGTLWRLGRFQLDPPAGRLMEVWPREKLDQVVFAPAQTTAVRLPTGELAANTGWSLTAPGLPEHTWYAPAVADVGPAELDDANDPRWLQLPSNLDPRVAALAEDIFADARTPAERIAAVRRYFRDNYQYQFGIVVPEGADPLTYFLLDRPPAHCEYFATGSAVLLRLAGVPTRYVAGFVATEHNTIGGYWLARNRDAHAWVEAWDAEAGRWVIVESTPADGVPQPREGDSWLGRLWDAVAQLFRRIRAAWDLYGPAGLLLMAWDAIVNLLRRAVSTLPGQAISAVLVGLIAWRIFARIRRRRRRGRPAPLPPELAELRALLRRLDRRLARLHLVRADSETLDHFAARLTAAPPADESALQSAADWYRQAARLRYAPSRPPADLDELRTRLAELELLKLHT